MVIEYARLLKWTVAHFRPARTAKGWRTPVSADGKGFPDLVMVRYGFVVIAELKMPGNKLTPDQAKWIDRFQQAEGERLTVRVWYPYDWPDIEATLR